MSGELIPAPIPEPRPRAGPSEVFQDFLSRLRPYRPPRLSPELGRTAAIGAGLTIAAGLLLAALPPPAVFEGRRLARLYRWTGDSVLASLVSVRFLALYVLCIGAACGIVVGAALLLNVRGRAPVLLLLSAQPWLGVVAMALAVVPWLAVIVLAVLNIVIEIVIGILMAIAMMVVYLFVLAVCLSALLGALTGE